MTLGRGAPARIDGGGLGATDGAGAGTGLPRRHRRPARPDPGAAGRAGRHGCRLPPGFAAGQRGRFACRDARRRAGQRPRRVRRAAAGAADRRLARRARSPRSSASLPGSPRARPRAWCAARTATCIWAISASGTAPRCRSTRIEFDEAMATIDLGYDLAFLLMDLDHRVIARRGEPRAQPLRGAHRRCRADRRPAGLPVDARDDPRPGRGDPRQPRRRRRLSGPRVRLSRAAGAGDDRDRRPDRNRQVHPRPRAGADAGRRPGRAGAAQRRDPQAPARRRAGAAPAGQRL